MGTSEPNISTPASIASHCLFWRCTLHQLRGAVALLTRSHCACSASTARQSGLQQAPGGPSRGSPHSRAWGTPSRRWQPRPRPSRRTLTASRCEQRARPRACSAPRGGVRPGACGVPAPYSCSALRLRAAPLHDCEDSQPVSGPAYPHCHTLSTAAPRVESAARLGAPREVQRSHRALKGYGTAQPEGPGPWRACMCSHLSSSAHSAMHRKGVTGGHRVDGRHEPCPGPALNAACAKSRRRWSPQRPRRRGGGWCGPWRRRRLR